MSDMGWLRDLLTRTETDERVERNRRVVTDALIDEQKRRVEWLERMAEFGASPGDRATAIMRLDDERKVLERLEGGELEEFHRALGL
jgi:hypothetical protein